MNVVDSSGWLEFFVDGENAHFFEGSILNTDQLVVPSICIYEVFKHLSKARGDDEALRAVAIMALGQEVVLDREIAISAAQVSLEYKLPMADSIILATAQSRNALLWTQDKHFKEIPGVQYIQKA
jgi:predicted nucleic acid-binding protein